LAGLIAVGLLLVFLPTARAGDAKAILEAAGVRVPVGSVCEVHCPGQPAVLAEAWEKARKQIASCDFHLSHCRICLTQKSLLNFRPGEQFFRGDHRALLRLRQL
jgi:hypothetical protein